MTGFLPAGGRGSPAHEPALERLPWRVLDSFLEGCQVIGFDGTYLYVNPAAAAQGRRSVDELVGGSMTALYPGIDTTPMFSLLRRCLEERAAAQMENEFTYPDGSTGWFELRFIPVPEGAFILSLDISERKRAEAERRQMEEQLHQAQRLETIGRLAGGVAHDFNNLLAVIIGHSELAIEALPSEHPVRPDLAEIQATCQRAAALTQQLLAFSRRQVLRPEVVEPAAVIAGMEPMLRRLIREDIELVLLPGLMGAKVRVDRGQLEQVVMNLVVNSRDAMPNGGRLSIGSAVVDLDDSYAGRHITVGPGPYVMLSVTDTGIGMDQHIQAHMFEPFFTTKPLGKGTGLGLATVYGIVKQSGGHIWVYSEPGRGTAVKVYLPLDPSESTSAPAPAVRTAETGRGETVLLVEDEAGVRDITRRILTRAGYRVLASGDSSEALEATKLLEEPVDLILTDVVMPRMNGRELADGIAERWPGIKVLFMSGYTDEAIVHHGVLEPGVHFISKPFTAAALTRKIRELLDGPPTA